MNTPNSDPRPNPDTRRGVEPRRPLRTSDLAAAGALPDDSDLAAADAMPEESDLATASAMPEESEELSDERPAPELRTAAVDPRTAALEPRTAALEPRTSSTELRAPTREARTAKAEAAPRETLEALFPPDTAAQFRQRWTQVQSGFVDDPRRAVADGDELVAEVMRTLAGSFAHERQKLEGELSQTGEASTETLRVGLRRYRSFFERLLAL